jgi:hypothetical protein
MDYLFRGVLPPYLPPAPPVELRQSDGQKKGKMMAREVRMQTIKPPKCLPHSKRNIWTAVLKTAGWQARLQSTKPPEQTLSLDLETM